MFCKGQGRKCTWKCFVNCKALCQWTVLIFRRCPRTLRSCRFNFNNWTAGFSKEREFPSPTGSPDDAFLRTPWGRVAQLVPHWDAPGSWYRVQKWEQNRQMSFFLLLTIFFSFQSTGWASCHSIREPGSWIQYWVVQSPSPDPTCTDSATELCISEKFSGFVSFFRPMDFNPGCTLEFHEEFIFLIPVWALSQSNLTRIDGGNKHQFTLKAPQIWSLLGNHHLQRTTARL